MENVYRYAKNRKLYSSEQRRYVNLDDVYQFVFSGRLFKVLDHDTGEDVTLDIIAAAMVRAIEKGETGDQVRARKVLAEGVTLKNIARLSRRA